MEKSSTDVSTDHELITTSMEIETLNGNLEVHTPDCLAESLKKVVIDESKNTVQEAPPQTVQLKPDTPKIAIKQYEYKYLLTDSLTDSTIGLYPTNKIATSVLIELVKKDILLYIDMFQKKILIGESIEENRNCLSLIKNLIYQYRTIEQTMNTSIMLENKMINRYRIMSLKVDEREVDEGDFLNF
jgi:hypothetical protein